MSIKYSVIIPAYNAEKTIQRCMDSLVCIIRDDVELLIINDGSHDRTEEICLKYAEKYSNVRYFYKENGGVSSARNVGLDHAEGKYILFVDSDDFVQEGYFEAADKVLIKNWDFVLFGRYVYDGNSVPRYFAEKESRVAEDPEKSAEILSSVLERQILNAPSSKIFKRKIIEEHGIRFDERLPIGEDKVFVVQYIMYVLTVAVINQAYYVLSIENQESLSRKKRENLAEYILLEHELLFRVVEDSDLKKTSKNKYLAALNYSYYRSAYTVIAELQKMKWTKKQRLKATKDICKKYNSRIKCKLNNFKCIVLAMPIKLYMCRIVDFMLRKKMG